MKKEFIPYEQSLELKELGFNETCIFYYDCTDKEWVKPGEFARYNYNVLRGNILAPLYQQAFRWFREKYGLHSYIQPTAKNLFIYKIINVISFDCGLIELSETPSDKPQEAELACLIKLIEIAKNK